MESYQKRWNKQQTELRQILSRFEPEQHAEAMERFFSQHAMLHEAKMAPDEAVAWSFADEILNDMTEDQIRRIPRNCDHSVAWLLWHMARIEDVTMNLLVAGSPQCLTQDNWLKRMKMTNPDTGNAMAADEVVALSATIDIEALRAYRLAVGHRTREIVKPLQPADLRQKVGPAQLQQLMTEGAVGETARGLIDYWGKRTKAGLLLMPATRHNFIHLNEAARLKRRRR